jgi:hypothetical protein
MKIIFHGAQEMLPCKLSSASNKEINCQITL